MIVNALIDLVNTLLTYAISLRPAWEWHIPSQVSGAITWISGLDYLLPVTETFQAGALALTLLLAVYGWKWVKQLFDWVVAMIP